MANVMLDFMHKIGFDDMKSFGDSTGTLPLSYVSPAAATSSN